MNRYVLVNKYLGQLEAHVPFDGHDQETYTLTMVLEFLSCLRYLGSYLHKGNTQIGEVLYLLKTCSDSPIVLGSE